MDASLIIACPHCNARNRVPETRLAQSHACGQCHQPGSFGLEGFDALVHCRLLTCPGERADCAHTPLTQATPQV